MHRIPPSSSRCFFVMFSFFFFFFSLMMGEYYFPFCFHWRRSRALIFKALRVWTGKLYFFYLERESTGDEKSSKKPKNLLRRLSILTSDYLLVPTSTCGPPSCLVWCSKKANYFTLLLKKSLVLYTTRSKGKCKLAFLSFFKHLASSYSRIW